MPPPLPMYVPPATAPDAWHQTVAPGGYESWHLTARDPADGGTFLLVSLMTGCPYDPEYLRRYRAYRARPTSVTPPLPPQWPAAHLVLVRGDRVLHESLTRLPAEMFAASAGGLDVTVGLSRLVRLPDSLRLMFRGRTVRADLTLHTISSPGRMERAYAQSQEAGEHRWAVVASPCNVKGEIVVVAAKRETIALSGRAAVDHDLGTRPPAEGYAAWMRGAAFVGRSCVPLRVACSAVRPADCLAAIVAEEGGVVRSPVEATKVSWSPGKRPHPTHVEVGSVIRMDSPRVVAGRGPVMTVLYRATDGHGQTGPAVCQVFHPNRLPRGAARTFLSPKLSAPAEIGTAAVPMR